MAGVVGFEPVVHDTKKTVETLIMVLVSIKIRDLLYQLYHALSVFSLIWALVWAPSK